jgi:hypothetical protein
MNAYEDDKAMGAMADRKWRHLFGHECNHATWKVGRSEKGLIQSG